MVGRVVYLLYSLETLDDFLVVTLTDACECWLCARCMVVLNSCTRWFPRKDKVYI